MLTRKQRRLRERKLWNNQGTADVEGACPTPAHVVWRNAGLRAAILHWFLGPPMAPAPRLEVPFDGVKRTVRFERRPLRGLSGWEALVDVLTGTVFTSRRV